MKQIIAIIISLIVCSCEKKYTCECSTIQFRGSGGSITMSMSSDPIKNTRKAKKECEQKSYNLSTDTVVNRKECNVL